MSQPVQKISVMWNALAGTALGSAAGALLVIGHGGVDASAPISEILSESPMLLGMGICGVFGFAAGIFRAQERIEKMVRASQNEGAEFHANTAKPEQTSPLGRKP